jgi:hypothetical protein
MNGADRAFAVYLAGLALAVALLAAAAVSVTARSAPNHFAAGLLALRPPSR